jgi:hypothetical protein
MVAIHAPLTAQKRVPSPCPTNTRVRITGGFHRGRRGRLVRFNEIAGSAIVLLDASARRAPGIRSREVWCWLANIEPEVTRGDS